MEEESRYLLALYTSPRARGNTALLLDAMCEGAAEGGFGVKPLRVAEMDIRPCRACDYCFKDGECIQDDDMQAIYPHLVGAGAVAMAAPVFSMNVCAQAKALIDRCQRQWAIRYVLRRTPVDPALVALRRGFFLSCCGRDRPETFDCTRPVMAYFFHIIGVGKWDSLTFAGVDEAGAIREVEGALEEAKRMGSSLARKE